MTRPLPLGVSSFRKLRRSGARYVDKTDLITELLRSGAEATLFLRPRRFGKTLNLSTLRYYLERSEEDRRDLFEGLHVWDAGPEVRRHFQRYPVIFLSLKDVKASTWDGFRDALAHEMSRLYREHRQVLDSGALSPEDREAYRRILTRSASDIELASSLRDLSDALARAHDLQVCILIDEYDTPIHAALEHDLLVPVLELFRRFLSGALKDNEHLFKGVLTGILRVAKESIFSGLNNLSVRSLLSEAHATHFGFTELEVAELARSAGGADSLDGLRHWYNGYVFGGQVVYNPWSVLSFLASPDHSFQPYWVNTASNELVRRLIVRGGPGVAADLETLLDGGALERRVDENIALRQVHRHPGALWSFLVSSGYLKATDFRHDNGTARLSIPNREVEATYAGLFQDWLRDGLGGTAALDRFVQALLAADLDTLRDALADLVRTHLSYHDVGGRGPEAVYQAFIIGLLVHLRDAYRVRSNRESGYGRYDVLIAPRAPGRPGVILELKAVDHHTDEDAPAALEAALRQLRDRDYAAELRDAGADPIHEIAIVVHGKRVLVAATV